MLTKRFTFTTKWSSNLTPPIYNLFFTTESSFMGKQNIFLSPSKKKKHFSFTKDKNN